MTRNRSSATALTVHTPHPDSHSHGLADSCPRCQEHAAHPAASLDRENLLRLLRGECHTLLDEVAAQKLADAISLGTRLVELREVAVST